MKNTLLITESQLTVLRWDKGRFCGFNQFESCHAGFADFDIAVKKELSKPTRVLIDIAEENIQIESVLHLIGRNRYELLRRIKNRYFQQYTYCHISVQGRSEKDRRKDNILVSCVTNSAPIKKWIEILNRNKVPIIGIYSLPLVGEKILRLIKADQENALLVSPRISHGMRQSLYVKGKLKFTRSTTEAFSKEPEKSLISDIERTIIYLESEQHIDLEKKLHVFILTESDKYSESIYNHYTNRNIQFHLINTRKIFKIFQTKRIDSKYVCYLPFVAILMKNQFFRPHYLVPSNKLCFYRHFAIRFIWFKTALILVTLGVCTIQQVLNGRQVESSFPDIRWRIEHYKTLYTELEASIPRAREDIMRMKYAVDFAEKIRENQNLLPVQSMKLISETLLHHPQIQPVELQWVNNTNEDKPQNTVNQNNRNILAGRTYKSYVMLDAVVTEHNGDIGKSIKEVKIFAETLSAATSDIDVKITKLPYDVDRGSRMVGQSIGGVRKLDEAEFSLILYRLPEQRL